MSVVTLDEAKTHLNIASDADDVELQSTLDAAEAAIETYLGVTLTPTAVTEWHDGSRTQIVLDKAPIVDVTSVTEYSGTTAQDLTAQPLDGSTFDGYGYEVDSVTGLLSRTSSGYVARFASRVKVVYQAGYATLPADLKQAVLELTRHLWETQRGRSAGRPVPGYDEEYQPTGQGFAFPNRVMELLRPYRTPVIA